MSAKFTPGPEIASHERDKTTVSLFTTAAARGIGALIGTAQALKRRGEDLGATYLLDESEHLKRAMDDAVPVLRKLGLL